MKAGFCDFCEEKFSYFDYAATTFMPDSVIDRLCYYNKNICVSSGRGKGRLSDKADDIVQKSRKNIKNFFCPQEEKELIFYRGASYAINEIVYGIEYMVRPMDIILLGPYEHHSNYLPWREMSRRTGAIVFEMPLLEDGSINLPYISEIKDRIKIVSFSSVANTNGYQMKFCDFERIIGEDTLVVVDDSQRCAHDWIEHNSRIDCHIVNAHKMYGPKGIAGALVSRRMLDKMHPSIYGGGMVDRIGFPNVWKKGAKGFECGTIDVAGISAWDEACSYIRGVGFNLIKSMEIAYHRKVMEALKAKEKVAVISRGETASIISFIHDDIHGHDIEEAFSQRGVIVRAGHLCSQNSIIKYGMKPVVRISFGMSTDNEDVCELIRAIEEVL